LLAPGADYTPLETTTPDYLNGGGVDDLNYAYQFNDETLWIAGEAVVQEMAVEAEADE